jgi:hypoxia up-regulated 1
MQEWNKTMHDDQAKTPSHEKPKLLVADIAIKIADLDREVKYLINKAKTFKPKVKVEKKEANETKTTEKPKEEVEKVEEPEPVEEPPKEETQEEEEVVLELPEADSNSHAPDDEL